MNGILFTRCIKKEKKEHNTNTRLGNKEEWNMNFVKGMIIGTMATAGAVMIYQETKGKSNKMMMKKGKQFAKKLGIL